MLHARVETPACFAHREWSQDVYEFHLLIKALAGASYSKHPLRLHALQSCMGVRVPRRPVFGRKKRCAAQAEYGRLAAQA